MNEIGLLKDLFDKRGEFEVGLVATYGLNLNFLENYVLNLNALRMCDSLSIFTDPLTYAKLTEDNPRWLNKKYLVTKVPTKKIFHSKIYLLASEKKALFAIGSANLTREGMSSNLELLSFFEVSKEKLKYYSLLLNILDYFKTLSDLSGSKVAQKQVKLVSDLILGYSLKKSDNMPYFVNNLKNSIFDEIVKFINDKKPNSIKIISPFFDSKLAVIDALNKQYPGVSIEVLVQQGKSTFPIDKKNHIDKNLNLFVYKNIDRYIHGKSLIFNFKNTSILYMGSANCTRAALLEIASNGNFEVGLIGNISSNVNKEILSPLEIQPEKLNNISELEVIQIEDKKFDNEKIGIDLILQTEKKGDNIVVSINKKNIGKLVPKTLIAKNTNDEVKVNLPSSLHTKVSLSHSKDLDGLDDPFFIRIEGLNESGEMFTSNISWVINLDNNSKNNIRKVYRRIYSNPFELASYIQEIVRDGDIEQLKNFLLTFDVPFDLILPPNVYNHKNPWSSDGNLEGELTQQNISIFTGKNMIDIYKVFFDKLINKLEKHKDNPQTEKTNNFIYIISILFSLIEFINGSQFEKYQMKKILKVEEWASLREYYNVLLSYLQSSWLLMWGENSYSEMITSQLDDNEDDTEIRNFEAYIVKNDYFEKIEELVEIAKGVNDYFEYIKNQIQIDTEGYGLVKPKIFDRDVYLKESNKILSEFLAIKNKLKKYKENLK